MNANPSIAVQVISPCIAMYPETLAVWYHFFLSNLSIGFYRFSRLFLWFFPAVRTHFASMIMISHDISWYPMISHDIPWYSTQKILPWSVPVPPLFFFASDGFTRCSHWAWGWRCETTLTWAAAGLKITIGTISFGDSSLGWCGNMWTQTWWMNYDELLLRLQTMKLVLYGCFFWTFAYVGDHNKSHQGNCSVLWFAKCL